MRRGRVARWAPAMVAAALAAGLLSGCGAQGRSATFQLVERDGSGVTGTVTLTEVGDRRTRVQLAVSAPGHPLMPVHIHTGHCTDLTPQPRYPLADIAGGASDSEVAVSLEELETVPLAVNVHLSPDDWTTVACSDLPGAVALAAADGVASASQEPAASVVPPASMPPGHMHHPAPTATP